MKHRLQIQFGTAGLRGICGEGPDKINSDTIGRASIGLAAYLKETYTRPSVVIAYDSRQDSARFAKETAEIMCREGISAYLFQTVMPVPILSYAIRRLDCSAGVMITASHNPKEYNGYKVYHHTGRQILDQEAVIITQKINEADPSGLPALKTQKVRTVPGSIYEEYVNVVEETSTLTKEHDLKLVYTPLHGAGRYPVSRVLADGDFDVFMVPEQAEPDGNFTTCPSPNPENAEAFAFALKYGKMHNADLLIATDPDCDRLGVMVKDGRDSEYKLLSGNEIGTLLFHYMCEHMPDTAGKELYTSMVSTSFVDAIASANGIQVKRTPVGFKYIGELIEKNPDRFLFGFEESNGYLAGTYARDKDGVLAAALVCRMAAHYKGKGISLTEVLQGLYAHYGYLKNVTETITTIDREDTERILGLFKTPETIEEHGILRLSSKEGDSVLVRPSGTEPKIKVYYTASGADMQECEAKISRMRQILTKKLQEKRDICD